MSQESNANLDSYPAVSQFIAKLLGVDEWDGESEYYPFNSSDASKGFLEVVYPLADASGRLLRGASGNGPIFVFLYCRGSWTYLGEMHGAKAEAITADTMTEFNVYAHVSARSGIERRYQLSGGTYMCVAETDVTAQ